MIGLRNILIHGYHAVDPRVLWAIVEERLPELRPLLKELLEEAGKVCSVPEWTPWTPGIRRQDQKVAGRQGSNLRPSRPAWERIT